jgi:hypothetical protein
MRTLSHLALAPREPQAEPTDLWRVRSATHLEALRAVAEALTTLLVRWAEVAHPRGDGTPLLVLGSALDGLVAVERIDVPGAPAVPEAERRALHTAADCAKRLSHQLRALKTAAKWERPSWERRLDATLSEAREALTQLAGGGGES